MKLDSFSTHSTYAMEAHEKTRSPFVANAHYVSDELTVPYDLFAACTLFVAYAHTVVSYTRAASCVVPCASLLELGCDANTSSCYALLGDISRNAQASRRLETQTGCECEPCAGVLALPSPRGEAIHHPSSCHSQLA
jgi:hypothetical protein